MQSVIETLDGATTSGFSMNSMRWVPPEARVVLTDVRPELPVEVLRVGQSLSWALAEAWERDRLVRLSGMRAAYRRKRGGRW